jgi:hypothetical protein
MREWSFCVVLGLELRALCLVSNVFSLLSNAPSRQ